MVIENLPAVDNALTDSATTLHTITRLLTATGSLKARTGCSSDAMPLRISLASFSLSLRLAIKPNSLAKLLMPRAAVLLAKGLEPSSMVLPSSTSRTGNGLTGWQRWGLRRC